MYYGPCCENGKADEDRRPDPEDGLHDGRVQHPQALQTGTAVPLHFQARKAPHDNGHDDLVRTPEHYYDPNDFNRTIYHSRSTDIDSRIKELLDDAEKLIERCGGFDEVTEYQLLVRCLSEQTIAESGRRRLRTKEDGGMSSDLL